MTISRFVAKNAFRNRRRSTLTVLSVAFSLLLLTLMMSIWRAFFLDQGSAQSAQRLITRTVPHTIDHLDSQCAAVYKKPRSEAIERVIASSSGNLKQKGLSSC